MPGSREYYQPITYKIGPFRSPVTLVFLLVAVSVVLFAIMYAWALSYIRSDKKAPEFETTCYYSMDEDFIIEVGNLSKGEAISPVCTNFFLKDSGGKQINNRSAGSVKDIYGLDSSFYPSNFTFVDKDYNCRISPEDYFILRSYKNGGPAKEGQIFSLICLITDESMSSVELSTQTSGEFEYPTTRWNATAIDERNITIDQNKSVASRFQALYFQEIQLKSSLVYLGKEARNLTIMIMKENDLVGHHQYQLAKGDNVLVEDNFKLRMLDPCKNYEIQNITIEVLDDDSNQTLLTARTTIYVASLIYCSSGFSMNTSLVFLSLLLVFLATLVHRPKKT